MHWRRGGRGQAATRFGACALAVTALCACAPALDWREVRAQEGPVRLRFPCKPHVQMRQVALAGTRAQMALQVCDAGDLAWALTSADVADPARVGTALRELRQAAEANVQARAGAVQPLQVPGATPQPDSVRVTLSGRRPEGQPVESQVAVFALGTRVYQATVLGTRVAPEAADNFFASLQVAP